MCTKFLEILKINGLAISDFKKITIAAFTFKTPHVVEITLVAAMWHLLTGSSKDFRPVQHIFVLQIILQSC
jgi:hypothetical protein